MVVLAILSNLIYVKSIRYKLSDRNIRQCYQIGRLGVS